MGQVKQECMHPMRTTKVGLCVMAILEGEMSERTKISWMAMLKRMQEKTNPPSSLPYTLPWLIIPSLLQGHLLHFGKVTKNVQHCLYGRCFAGDDIL